MFPGIDHARQSKFAAGLLAALIMTGFGADAGSAQEKPMQRTVTVSATGTISAAPDQARISAGVMTQAETAQEALSANTAAMSKVLATIKELGVESADIQTYDLNISPLTRYDRSSSGGEPEVTGYRASNQVSVRVRDLKQLGQLMDAMVSAGANQMSGLSFEASKADELKDAARANAMATALRRAKLLAEAGGATVGRVLQISENLTHIEPRGPRLARMSAEAAPVPVETGSLDLSADVTVTWELE